MRFCIRNFLWNILPLFQALVIFRFAWHYNTYFIFHTPTILFCGDKELQIYISVNCCKCRFFSPCLGISYFPYFIRLAFLLVSLADQKELEWQIDLKRQIWHSCIVWTMNIFILGWGELDNIHTASWIEFCSKIVCISSHCKATSESMGTQYS